MAIEVKRPWIKTESGNWVNARHLDLVEVLQGEKNSGEWRVVAWNALQPQVEAYQFSTHKTEAEARKAASKLIEQLAD